MYLTISVNKLGVIGIKDSARGERKFLIMINDIDKVNKIRDILKVCIDEFKEQLDKYFQLIADEPKVGDLTASTCKPRPSLICAKGGRHFGKPSQIWNSPNGGGGGSRGPPDPDFNHVNENSRFLGEGGQGSHKFDFQILFLQV